MSDFSFVPVPIGRYRQQTFPALDADDQAARVAELVEEIGGQEEHWGPGPRDYSSVGGRLRAWAHPPAPRSSMLYWAGHGQALGPKAWLAVEDTPDPMTVNALNPASFAEYVIEEWRHRSLDEEAWALVVIEACGAKRFVEILLSRLYDEGGLDRLAVIGVGGYGAGYLGKFRQVLSDALSGYSDNDEAIQLRDLVGRVQDRLGDSGMVADLGLYQAPPLPRRRLTGPVTAPLDVYAELRDFVATLTPDERGHFLPKAQGAEQGELAWYFMGRREEGARIAEWLHTATRGMLVVTGEAGSGKSALLGNVVVQANPELSALLARAGMTDGPGMETLPPPHVFDAVLHLTGATTTDVVRQLAADDSVEDADQLVALLSERETPFTVLVDALDEAQDPLVVARGTLARIAEIDGVRVLIGTRGSTKEGPDSPAGEDTDILDALGSPPERVTVERDSAAADEYVRRRLLAGFPEIDMAELDAVRREIEARERHFLYARLAVHELMARPELLRSANREQRGELLAHDYRALFAAAVSRLGDRDPAYAPLLEALALGQGRGLPRTDGVWQIAARTLDSAAIDEAAVDALLADAAPYIMLDAEHGQSVYRLAHRTFQEHYFAARAGELPDRHRLIARGLCESAEAAMPSPPHPYLVHHLPGHVAAADDWQLLVSRPRLLDCLAPGAVAVEAARPRPGRAPLPDAVSAIRAAHHRLSAAAPGERGALRAVAEAQFRGVLPDPAGWWSRGASWAPVWADFSRLRSPTTSVFALECEKVTALAALRWGDGRTVVALAEEAVWSRIHFWDPVSQSMVGAPLTCSGVMATVLAAVPFDQERDHLAVGGFGGVEIWDPRERSQTEAFRNKSMTAVGHLAGMRTSDGRVLVAYAASVGSGEIRVRDLKARRDKAFDVGNAIGAMVGLHGNGGSPRLVVAAQSRSFPLSSRPRAGRVPVRILVAPADGAGMAAIPATRDQVVLAPSSMGRRPLSLWDGRSGYSTELPVMVDLAFQGAFTVVEGPGGELLLISITGEDEKVTVFEMPRPAVPDRADASPHRRSASVCAIQVPGHGDAFAVCSAEDEFTFRDAATGDLIDRPEKVMSGVTGPPGGPLLFRSQEWTVWTQRDGRRSVPELSNYLYGAAPFLSSDGRLLIAHAERLDDGWGIVCSEAPRTGGGWKQDCRVDGKRLRSPSGIRVLRMRGGGALILAYVQEHTIVFDHDHPQHIWELSGVTTTFPKGAALVYLPEPALAVCDYRKVFLWDLASRTRLAVMAEGNTLIADMAAVHVGAGPGRVVLAVAHVDGSLRLWDPHRPDRPIAVLALDMAASAIASAGSKICLVNEEGALCIDVGGLAGAELTRPPHAPSAPHTVPADGCTAAPDPEELVEPSPHGEGPPVAHPRRPLPSPPDATPPPTTGAAPRHTPPDPGPSTPSGPCGPPPPAVPGTRGASSG
ncbi:ATP-binding protein [Streptomyces cinnabarinus]|uniref:ATP-binding protein n=1 Tax=Streptomyces cinnabarinus TaxID=67287 RepID=A0ABY7KFM2_9ACTN|nr:ATP-binding protein [Streptomyces cinnabarinus]WAZ21741.1 ATP-binding protein [Streptomyces cinnabarinus]